MGGGDDDTICIGTVVMDRCTIRMGGDDDATGIEDCTFDQARIYGNGGSDVYSARNNILPSLLLRQYEVENASVQARVNQAGLHPTFEEAADFFESLDLDD